MKTRARRSAGQTPTIESTETEIARKPTLTVISNSDGRSGVRPKVHMHPKRVKEAAKPAPALESEPALLTADALPAPETPVAEDNTPARGPRLNMRFVLIAVLLVIVGNFLLHTLGAPAHRAAAPAPVKQEAASAAPESGIMVNDREVRPLSLPPMAVTTVTATPPEAKPAHAATAPVKAVPARDLMSIINQN